MARQIKLLSHLFLFIFLFGCAPVISEELRAGVDTSLTFKEVVQNPNTYAGKIVLWGGEIIQVLPQENGTDLIEVLEWPLGWREKPQRTVSFRGKVLVLLQEPLDLSLYRKGTKITVAGEIQGSMQGEKVKSASDPTYRYPLLLSKELHLWEGRFYSQSSVPDYRESWEYRHYGGILRY